MLHADDRATISFEDDEDLTFITATDVAEHDDAGADDDDLYEDRTYRGPAANGQWYPDDAPTWPNYDPYDRVERRGPDFEDETTERMRLQIDLSLFRR